MTRMDLNIKVEALNKQYQNPEPVVFETCPNKFSSFPDRPTVLAQYFDETPDCILSQQLVAWLTSQSVCFHYEICNDYYTELEAEVEVE